MADIKIPNKFLGGFEIIKNLSNSQIESLSDFLKSRTPSEKPDGPFASEIVGISRDNLTEIVSTIYSVIHLSVSYKMPLNELIKDLSAAFFSQSQSPINDNLSSNLQLLLENANNLKLSVKAADVMREKDKIYDSSRVLTDLRYIFDNNDLKSDNRLAVIIHNLKIAYQHNKNEEAFFVALSLDDLKDLKQQIDRAIEKEEIIKAYYANQEIVFVNL
ncbi:hypothetical protein [Chitinophaga silvisoli]|uniref:Uncharacterized protein n=1 Tax=Chitinophaga silvisoli TaxID=2291814 RepID=A0A3E1NST7_9BACT|nr:hypothetical protein [Chitinophaga silvisoli]RFM30973.1 hypothetical protein DXN04_30885 [Chitinophaga silvisoli]